LKSGFLKSKLTSALLLVVASLAVYANTLGNNFAYDDFPFIVQNEALRLPFSLMFWTPYATDGCWRPVVLFTHAANLEMGGLRPFGFHLFNIVAHAGVVLVLYFLLLRLFDRPRVAFAAALLFAVHPLHTEAVSAAYSRLEILAAGFVFAAWLFHAHRRFIAAALCFFLALGSKESALCFLGIVILADWRLERLAPRRVYAGYAAVAALYLALRTKVVGLYGLGWIPPIQNPLVDLSAPLRMANSVRLAGLMLWLHVFPARLSVDYSYNAIPVLNGFALAPWVIGAVALAAAWAWTSRKSQAVFVAGIVYAGGIALTSNFFVPVGTNIGERWAYLPSAGFCLLCGLAYEWLAERKHLVAVGALTAIVAALAARTVIRNFDWKGNYSLAVAAERAYPESVRVQHAVGLEYWKVGNIAEAQRHFLIGERICRDYPQLQYSMAMMANQAGDVIGTELHFRNAMRASAGYTFEPEYVVNYAALQIREHRYQQALALLNTQIASWPGDARALANRAVAEYRLNQLDKARADAQDALELNPREVQASLLLKRM